MSFVNTKLEEFNNYLDGRRVAIIGLGVSNIPLIEYMHEVGAETVIFDQRDIDHIPSEIMSKIIYYDMDYSLGEDYLSKLVDFDIIFRTPSCLPIEPALQLEASRGAIITTEIEMFMELCPGKIIGITGSDGKTTTTTLIYNIIKDAGLNCYLGGNIGIPLFTKVSEMTPDDYVILELSIFQLMEMEISPSISVITNVNPNHLNIHTDMEEYIDAKKNIFKHQDENGILILNYDNETTRSFAEEAKGKVILFSSENKLTDGYMVDNKNIKYCNGEFRTHILETKDMIIKGIHNYMNAACAIAATKDIVSEDSAIKTISEFKGVEHRLEFVKESKNKIKWYNDSASSSPIRTIVGLNAFSFKNVILIAGGYDKNTDYEPLALPVINSCKALVLIGQTADKIEKAVKKALLNNTKKIDIHRCDSMEDAIVLSNRLASKGDIVLFSPASASFDMFKNFADRGEQFKKFVNKNIF